MEQSFQLQINTGLAQDGEADEVKRIFLEGNPYLLALTMAVSMLHSVFDFLAFKNDIGFWRENKSMEGLSARSIVINAFCQAVIFLYLLDNETSMVVLFSAGAWYKVGPSCDRSASAWFICLMITPCRGSVRSFGVGRLGDCLGWWCLRQGSLIAPRLNETQNCSVTDSAYL
jgi:hypothetical protein